MSASALSSWQYKTAAGYYPVLLATVLVRRARRHLRARIVRHRLPAISDHMLRDVGLSVPQANRLSPRDDRE